VFTGILVTALVLLPVLIPAAITVAHAIAGIRWRRTNSPVVRDRVGYAPKPIPSA
jgi:hypothetical protein